MSQTHPLSCYKDVQSIDTEVIPQMNHTFELDKVVSEYGERLLRYATSILYNHQDAEDVVQEVFISAYQNSGAFDGGNLSAWLYKITYNKCMNAVKRRRFIFFGDIPENTVAHCDVSNSDREMLDILSLLKPQDRALVYARVIEGYTYEELSVQMGTSVAALRKRYERAKGKLAGSLSAEYSNINLESRGM